MHPDKVKLKSYVDGRLKNSEHSLIGKHLSECEICREYCDDYLLLSKSMELAESEIIPEKATDFAEKLFKQSTTSNIIPLERLRSPELSPEFNLVADGKEVKQGETKNIVTLFSRNPEVVLRVMHNIKQKQDYLQLISNDAKLTSQVMIQLPELNREFITNDGGYADAGDTDLSNCSNLKWQIKMPDAVFDLEPLVYDPEKVEYQKETILETEKHDKIQITFQRKTVGKQIILRILELDGSDEFESVKVVISQNQASTIITARPQDAVTFDITDSTVPINIRLFQ